MPNRLDQWPINTSLGVQPTMQAVQDAFGSLANWKLVEPDGNPVGLFEVILIGDLTLRKNFSTPASGFRGGGEVLE